MTAIVNRNVELTHADAYGRSLHCIAGFFSSEAHARAAADQLGQRHGLHPKQRLLLAPAQASWLSFRLQSRSWALGRYADGASELSDAPLMATFFGFTAGLTVVLGTAVAGLPEDGLALLLMLMWPLAGALAGWAVSARTVGPTQRRRFNRHVRRELAAGRWAVLAHRVPIQQQAGAAALLRELGIGWCVVSEPWRVL